MSVRWIALAAALFFAACGSEKAGPGGKCSDDGDCKDGYFCVDGKCAECRVVADCEEGEVCLDGECVQGCPPDDRCEAGGTCCPGDYECIDRACLPPCDGVRCGHRSELCCGQGQVCEDERCLVDCGANQRCGRNLDECCQAGEICYGFSCTAPQADCRTQSDCPPDQVCAAGQCYGTDCATPCGPDEVCEDGECVQADCWMVECEWYEVCVDGNLILNQTVRKNQVIVGVVNANRRHFEAVLRDMVLIKKRFPGFLTSLITHRFRLDEYGQALGPRTPDQIKVVFEIAEGSP